MDFFSFCVADFDLAVGGVLEDFSMGILNKRVTVSVVGVVKVTWNMLFVACSYRPLDLFCLLRNLLFLVGDSGIVLQVVPWGEVCCSSEAVDPVSRTWLVEVIARKRDEVERC